MTPLPPTGPLPLLTGLGVNVRATIPGYPTTAPDGHRRWILGHDQDDRIIIDEDHTHGVYIVHAPDLPGPLAIDEDDINRAAFGVANLIQARVHDARRRAARHAELAILDDPVDELLAGMVARALAGAA